MGESYAGIDIPYFTQAILANQKGLPIYLKAIALGDGTFGIFAAATDVVATTYMRQQNEIPEVPQSILDVFGGADELYGFNKVLKQIAYPPRGSISIPEDLESENFRERKRQDSCISDPNTPALMNQSINTCNGGCATATTGLSVYNVAYTFTTISNVTEYVSYLNLPAIRKAIHAPNKTYIECNSTVQATLSQEYVEPPAYSIIPAVSEEEIEVHIYSGDYDFLLNHIGTELVIQNMTWYGQQGLQCELNKTILVDGKNMGNWDAERGLSYHHVMGADHALSYDQPAAAFAFVRDFVDGNAGYQ